MKRALISLRERFYAGPRHLGIRPPRRNNYQSPTITAGYWLYAFGVAHFSLAGAVFFLCMGLLGLYATFSLMMPIHLLAFAILALFLINIVLGLVLRPDIEVERILPERITANTESRVNYTVKNLSRRPVWNLCLDTFPLPRGLSFPHGRSELGVLPGRESTECSSTILALKRGRYVIPAVRGDSSFPFHLWRWGVTDEKNGTGESLTVFPEFTPLTNLELSTGARYQQGGIALSSHVGESMEFQGCREFRSGDNPRHIHWRSWARTGEPAVKEFCEEYLCRTALVLDTARTDDRAWWKMSSGKNADSTFEAALSLTAAISDYLAKEDYVIDLFAAGPRVHRFQSGRSLAYLENILDILASLDPHPGEPFGQFSSDLVEEIAQISSVILVLTGWNRPRHRMIEEIAAAGASLKVIFMRGTESPPPGLPDSARVVTPEDILAGRCVSL